MPQLMCGVFGYLGPPARMPSRRAIERATGALAHRGPDAQGLFRDESQGLVLGHARLSIIDPDGRSDQPFETEATRLVFNGEIFNFRQLRAEMQRLGVVFRTDGDTEVIAAGYALWGEAIFGRLRGMFALALYDRRARRLHLARDEFGIKPLCMLQRQQEIVFASEIKAILADPGVPRELNLNGLSNFLGFGHAVAPETIYRNIFKLLPGHYLLARNNDVQIVQYWDVGEEPQLPAGSV
ncbi:MAG TPA: asparagine synthetase B, partial [Ramlibacter sp.]|nr:asparagine synthetase B [Ramlibacter sp.]